MPTQRLITATNFIASIDYELRNTTQKQYTQAEMLDYLNKAIEMAYNILVHDDSELIRSGSGTITTIASAETYSLTATMGDLWSPSRVYIAGQPLMELINEIERYENNNYGYTGMPERFYMAGEYMGFSPIPDAVYTIIVKYYPNFIPLALTDNMPFKNLFNLQIAQAVKILAKNRESVGFSADAVLNQMLAERALEIARTRTKFSYDMSVDLS